MERSYEQLAGEFAAVPVHVYGFYRTVLEAGKLYNGHRRRRTEKGALLIALRGGARFAFTDAQGRLSTHELTPGSAVIGGLDMSLEIEVGRSDFEYALIHYLPCPVQREELRHLHAVTELRLELDPAMLELIRRLSEVAALPGSMERLEKKALFYTLLSRVLASARNCLDSRNGSAMERTVQYIHANYMKAASLEDLAGISGMKIKHFSHLFRNYTGMSPVSYLIRYRMNRAHELLLSGRFSVREVAAGVGYADPYYFSRLFKANKGLAPSEVKMLIGENNPS